MQQTYELSRDSYTRAMAWSSKNDHCWAHFHSTVEVVYVESGALSVLQDGVTTLVESGMLIVNSSYMLHGYATPEASRCYIATIPLNTVPALRAQLKQHSFARSIVDARDMKECRRILRMMADPANRDNEPFVNALGEALLALLMERVGLRENTADAESDLMKRILIYLQDHAAEPISQQDAAAHFGYSVGRFSHLFNARIGCPFPRYVNSLRCIRAQELLAHSSLSLIDVAAACGFSSLRTFHRVYKDFTGETPRAAQRSLFFSHDDAIIETM